MPDVATIAVLRDVAMLVIVGLALGIPLYTAAQRYRWLPAIQSSSGVATHPFDLPEAVLSALLLFMLLGGLMLTGATEQIAARTAPNSEVTLSALLGQVIFMTFVTLTVLLWFQRVRSIDPLELFGIRRLRTRQVFITATFWIVPTMIIVSLVGDFQATLLKDIWPMTDPQEIVKSFQTTDSLAVKVVMAFSAVVAAPICEELTFRGLFYGVFKRYTDTWFGAIASALLFATVHLHVGSFVPLFVLALALIAAYEYTGSLLVPMAMHGIFNSVMLLAMLGGAE